MLAALLAAGDRLAVLIAEAGKVPALVARLDAAIVKGRATLSAPPPASRRASPPAERSSDAELIAQAVAAGRVTRCPAAAVAPTTATIPAADRAALETRAQPVVRGDWHKAARRRAGART